MITGIDLEGSSEKYNSNTLITFDKAGNYEFYYQGSVVSLTIKDVIPKYILTCNPVSAELSKDVQEVSTIVTCTSDTGEVSDIVYETAPDVVHPSPYPAVKAVFIVNLLDVVDKTELTWESNDISEQGINILVPEGTEWSLKIE